MDTPGPPIPPPEIPPLRPPLRPHPAADEPPNLTLDDLRQWYEARAERRMRGQHEGAVRAIVQLLDDASTAPLRLTAVRIYAPHTRSSFLSSLLSPYLVPPPSSPQTLQTVLLQTRSITCALLATSLFPALSATLVPSPSPLARPSDVELLLRPSPPGGRGRYFLKGSTDVGHGEASASVTARISDVTGGADTLGLVLSTGTRTRRAFEATYEAPLIGLARRIPGARAAGGGRPGWEMGTRAEVGVWGAERDWTAWAGCWEGQTGGKVGLSTRTPLGAHTLTYNLVARHIHTLAPTASLSTRFDAGESTKSSVSHTLSHAAPDRRWSYRLAQELAGLGGDAKFVKLEADFSRTVALTSSLSASLTTRTALVRPLSSRPILLPDRLFLGGPTSVRMFHQNRMGPHDGGYATGGEIALSAGLSLLGRLPGRARDWPLQYHLFLNAGSLNRLLPSHSLLTQLNEAARTPSVSVGVGVVMRFLEGVRVEVNVGVPLVKREGEGERRGLGVGVGVEFL